MPLSSHNLSCACHWHFFIFIFSIKNSSCISIYQTADFDLRSKSFPKLLTFKKFIVMHIIKQTHINIFPESFKNYSLNNFLIYFQFSIYVITIYVIYKIYAKKSYLKTIFFQIGLKITPLLLNQIIH